MFTCLKKEKHKNVRMQKALSKVENTKSKIGKKALINTPYNKKVGGSVRFFNKNENESILIKTETNSASVTFGGIKWRA